MKIDNETKNEDQGPPLKVGDFVCPDCYQLGPFGAIGQYGKGYRTRVNFYKYGEEPGSGTQPYEEFEISGVGDGVVAVEIVALREAIVTVQGWGGLGDYKCLKCGCDIDKPHYLQNGHDVALATAKQQESTPAEVIRRRIEANSFDLE